MRILSRQFFRHGIGRRCLCALLLGAYVLTATGIPCRCASGPAKSGEAFPCAKNRCGCDSADRCWRSCCCHTLAERIAWARRHGVQPPAFAIAQARAAGIDLSLLAEACDAEQQPAQMLRYANDYPKSPPVAPIVKSLQTQKNRIAPPMTITSSACAHWPAGARRYIGSRPCRCLSCRRTQLAQ